MSHRRSNVLGRWPQVTLIASVLIAVLSSAVSAQTFYNISGTLRMSYLASVPARWVGTRVGVGQGNGTGPVDFTIPANLWYSHGSTFMVFPTSPNVAQVSSVFTASHQQVNLAAGGGPGNFAWCPPAGNPANPGCTDPGQATGGFNGLITYTAGPNQFGGSISILRKTAGETSRRIATNPLQFQHTARTSSNPWAAGGPASNQVIAQRPPGVITQSPVLGPSGSIQTPGIYVGPGVTPPTIFATGHPLTTGMIAFKDSVPAPQAFTVTGSDMRTPAGAGAIQLVGGAFFQQPGATPSQAFGSTTRLTLTIPEPAATLGLAAGIAGLVGLQRLRKRRSVERTA